MSLLNLNLSESDSLVSQTFVYETGLGCKRGHVVYLLSSRLSVEKNQESTTCSWNWETGTNLRLKSEWESLLVLVQRWWRWSREESDKLERETAGVSQTRICRSASI